jgi:hypothetical protein
MKVLTLVTLVFGTFNFAFAAPIFCGQPENPYQVRIDGSWNSARLTIDGAEVDFGNLVCYPDKDNQAPEFNCASANVNDAGYSTYLHSNENGELSLDISETSFFGSKPITTLDCQIFEF